METEKLNLNREVLRDVLARVERAEMTPKEGLHALEQTGLFLFHGTPDSIGELEPRQPHTIEKGKRVPHGDPSVCVTPYADIAIFRALVNKKLAQDYNLSSLNSSFGTSEAGVFFTIKTEEALQYARQPDHAGYVLVCSRDGFQPFSPSEWRSSSAVQPVVTVRVTGADLPEEVEVRDRSNE